MLHRFLFGIRDGWAACRRPTVFGSDSGSGVGVETSRGSSGPGEPSEREIEKAMIELLRAPYPWERSARVGEVVLIAVVLMIVVAASAALIACGVDPGSTVELIAAALVAGEILERLPRRDRRVLR